jgi:hypothetical protein
MYVIYYPSGRLFKDGVLINQVDGDPDYLEYLAWLGAGNGPTPIPDPYTPPVTATIARIALAMEQLGIVTPDASQMANQIFPLAVTL